MGAVCDEQAALAGDRFGREGSFLRGEDSERQSAGRHFDLTMQENGHTGAFVFEDPGLEVPENVYYIVTYERTK